MLALILHLLGQMTTQKEILLKHTGLTKVDIAAMHASLVDIACSKPQRRSSQAELAAAKDFTIANADTSSDLQGDAVVSIWRVVPLEFVVS